MASALFGSRLNSLSPSSMLRTEARPHLLARQAVTAAAPPSNEAILEAAKASYQASYGVVDANITSGIGYAKSTAGHPKVAALNAYNWKSQQAGPITPTAQQVFAAPEMKAAVGQVTDSKSILSMVIGISESAQIIVGEEGGIGVGFGIMNNSDVKGIGYVAGKLGLDVDVSLNLQIGLWNAAPAQLAGPFYGIEVAGDFEVGVCLGIYLTPGLTACGFSIGVGVGVGGGATVVGGYTWAF